MAGAARASRTDAEALRRATFEQLGAVSASLCVANALLAGAHLLLVAPEHRLALSLGAAGASVMTGAAWLTQRRAPARAEAHAHALMAGVLGVAVLTSGHHIVRTGELWQSTNLLLVLLGGAALTLAVRALAALWLGAWVAFGLCLAVWAPPAAAATHWAFALVMGNVVAVVIFLSRRRQILRLSRAEREAGARARAAEALAADLAVERQRALSLAAERDALLGALSHELRSPLQALIGAAELLAPAAATPAQRQAAQTLSASGAMMLHVVNQVLEHRRAAEDGVELRAEPVHLPGLIDEVFLVLADRAAQRGDLLCWSPTRGPLPVVTGDRGRVRQILLNLVSNAVKFTADGLVRVEVDAPGPDGCLELRVIDSGVGFDPSVAERIFEPYRQAGPEISGTFGGTGLGLSISRALARQMGGDLWATGRPGAGATFTLRLHLPAAAAPPAPLAGTTVSVVGDAPLRVDLVARLQALGAEVVSPLRARRHLLLRGGPSALRLTALGAEGAQPLLAPWSDAELALRLGGGAQVVAAAPALPARPAPARAVLLVDDAPASVLPLQLTLEAAGHHVEAVTSAPAALAAVQVAAAAGRPFTLVITDLHLGGMDGIALARALGRGPAPPRVWLLSGDTVEPAALEGAGVEQVLLKPVSPKAIEEQIAASLESARAA